MDPNVTKVTVPNPDQQKKAGRATATGARKTIEAGLAKKGDAALSRKTPRLVTIDPNIGLPSRELNPEEPAGLWFTLKKRLAAFWATKDTEQTVANRDRKIGTTLRELAVYIGYLICICIVEFMTRSPAMYNMHHALEGAFMNTKPKFADLVTFDQMYQYYSESLLGLLYAEDSMALRRELDFVEMYTGEDVNQTSPEVQLTEEPAVTLSTFAEGLEDDGLKRDLEMSRPTEKYANTSSFNSSSSTLAPNTSYISNATVASPAKPPPMKRESSHLDEHPKGGKVMEDDVYILYTNRLIGLPRMRQLRVQNNTCSAPAELNVLSFLCHGDFNAATEDKTPFGLAGKTWRYRDQNETRLRSYQGQCATYPGTGFIQNFLAHKEDNALMLGELKQHGWIDQGTSALFVDFTVYNPNLNLFATIRLLSEYPASGGMVHSVDIRVSNLIELRTNADYFPLVAKVIFVALTAYYIVEEIIEFNKLGAHYFWSPWSFLDIVVILLAVADIGLQAWRYYCVQLVLARMPDVVKIHNATEDGTEEASHYLDFEYLSLLHVAVSNVGAFLAFCAWIKIFKYLSFNRSMMQLSHTLSRASKDLLNFAVMFFIVFFAFAQLGYFLFGTQVEGYSNPKDALTTLLRVILGDFQYEELLEGDPVIGPTFFFFYIFFVFFILLNMFLAIINETYIAVKEELAQKRNDFEAMEYLKKGLVKIFRKLVSRWSRKDKEDKLASVQEKLLKRKALDEINRWQNDLQNRGYTDEEIEAVFGNYFVGAQPEAAKTSAEIDSEKLMELGERIERIERALKAIQGHFEGALNKLDMMERAKLNRSRKMDAIIDHLDEGEFITNERKEELTVNDLERRRSKRPIPPSE